MKGYGNSFGAGYGFGASMNMLGGYGHMGGHGMEPDFGVIATLDIQGGANAFKINGLGPFTKIEQLAGRGVLVSGSSDSGGDSGGGDDSSSCGRDSVSCVAAGVVAVEVMVVIV